MPKLQFQREKGVQPLQEAEDHQRLDRQAIAPRQGGLREDTFQASQGQEDHETQGSQDRHDESRGQADFCRHRFGISFQIQQK